MSCYAVKTGAAAPPRRGRGRGRRARRCGSARASPSRSSTGARATARPASTRPSGWCSRAGTTRGRSARGRHSRGSRAVSNDRQRRVAEVVRKVVSESLVQLSDPGLGFVTVTGVEVTPEFETARVYVQVLGGERKREKGLAALERARGVLQERVARQMTPAPHAPAQLPLRRVARPQHAHRRADRRARVRCPTSRRPRRSRERGRRRRAARRRAGGAGADLRDRARGARRRRARIAARMRARAARGRPRRR